jgi:twinfilin-like protein
MALQVVQITDEVTNAFANARTGGEDVRYLQLTMDLSDENTPVLRLKHTQAQTNSFENDFESIASQIDDSNKPYFFLVRLEDPSEWVLVWYVPDNSKVRQKMLFSSTVNHLKNVLGTQYLIGDYHTTHLEELAYGEFKRGWTHPSKRHEHTGDLLTERERVAEEERNTSHAHFSGPTKVGVHGLNIPFDQQAQQQVDKFVNGQISHLALKIDSEKEEVTLVTVDDATTVDEVRQTMSATEPSYHLFRLSDSIFFIYACPTASKVKLRMIYSATKSNILGYLSSIDGVQILRNVEISDPSDLSEELLLPEDLSNMNKIQKITKPKRPGRGNARIAKTSTPQDQ